MSPLPKKYLIGAALFLIFGSALFFATRKNAPTTIAPATTSTKTPARVPDNLPLADDATLKKSIISAGDYLVRQQLPNGEMAYQVDIFTNDRSYSPSYVRLIAGTGSLYTVCRVSGSSKYCEAGDAALIHYWDELVRDPKRFKGACFYSEGGCKLGASALAVDAIYKRWQATGDFFLQDRNLLNDALNLGYFIVSMRRPEGGFYHSFDPHFEGVADPNYFVAYFPGESLLALIELYEMTGNEFWLQQAREVNAHMIKQLVTEDHWHGYAFSKFARLKPLSKADQHYAETIALVLVEGEVRSLQPKNTAISAATKVEALATLAQALQLSGVKHEKLDPELRAFMTFVQARQLPANDCNWEITAEMKKRFGGGVFNSCEEATIRIDGAQHWINGATAYLEYLGMGK